MTLTPAQVAEIAERARRATPGPWVPIVDQETGAEMIVAAETAKGDGCCGTIIVTGFSRPEDQVFAAEARSDIPALLADRAALVEENERLLKREKESTEYYKEALGRIICEDKNNIGYWVRDIDRSAALKRTCDIACAALQEGRARFQSHYKEALSSLDATEKEGSKHD